MKVVETHHYYTYDTEHMEDCSRVDIEIDGKLAATYDHHYDVYESSAAFMEAIDYLYLNGFLKTKGLEITTLAVPDIEP